MQIFEYSARFVLWDASSIWWQNFGPRGSSFQIEHSKFYLTDFGKMFYRPLSLGVVEVQRNHYGKHQMGGVYMIGRVNNKPSSRTESWKTMLLWWMLYIPTGSWIPKLSMCGGWLENFHTDRLFSATVTDRPYCSSMRILGSPRLRISFRVSLKVIYFSVRKRECLFNIQFVAWHQFDLGRSRHLAQSLSV